MSVEFSRAFVPSIARTKEFLWIDTMPTTSLGSVIISVAGNFMRLDFVTHAWKRWISSKALKPDDLLTVGEPLVADISSLLTSVGQR
jgi:hypothetical protein